MTIFSLCLLTSACFGQEEYRNKDWHFSFPIPEGWDIITDEFLLEDHASDMEIRFDDVEILALLLKESPQGKIEII